MSYNKGQMTELDILKQECLDCQKCELHHKRRNVVFGSGNPQSPLLLIGEGPGDQEDLQGIPFVGKAGKLLEKALAENQLTREDVYIANVVKCRACDWIDGKPKNRPPTDIESQECRNWLLQQINIIRPHVILCIGSPSARNIIKKDFKITVERGLYFPCEFAKTAIATLHPAYILRQQNIKSNAQPDGGYSLLVADIAKAWNTAQELQNRSKSSFTSLTI